MNAEYSGQRVELLSRSSTGASVTAVNRESVVDLRDSKRAVPARVVVADDLPEVRLLLRATLEQAGISVVAEATNGVERWRPPRCISPTSWCSTT